MFLAGDIGGTKSAFAMFDTSGQLLHSATYNNADSTGLQPLIARFIGEHRQQYPELYQSLLHEATLTANGLLQGMCLGVAGPVHQHTCQMTNLPWFLDARQLEDQFGMPCLLINDLEAFAWSLPFLPDADFHRLQGPQPPPSGTIAVISIGTGLGEAALLCSQERYGVLPGEGGHKNFAPRSLGDTALLVDELKNDDLVQVSAETLISGLGLPRLLRHVGGEGSLLDLQAHADFPSLGINALILREGLGHPDSVCAEVLRRFVALIAHEAADIALQYGAEGGVVIGGGIPPRMASLFDSAAFREQFADKRTHHSWLRQLSVRLCMNASAPLWGAFHCLRLTNAGQRLL